jgi:hypothetical protein
MVLCVGKLVVIDVNHGKKYAKEHAREKTILGEIALHKSCERKENLRRTCERKEKIRRNRIA